MFESFISKRKFYYFSDLVLTLHGMPETKKIPVATTRKKVTASSRARISTWEN